MRTVVAGSGPVGMASAVLLARQGHEVTLVDRDPGPVQGTPWERVGVMQFHLPHGFRSPARSMLIERLPDVYEAVRAAGALDGGPVGVADPQAMLHVRRSVFEQAMWTVTSREPGIRRVTGHVDEILVDAGVAHGVVVDSRTVAADLVVDATGRAGRPSAPFRPPLEGADCGLGYAARLYRLHPGAEPGPLNGGPGFVSEHQGFLLLIFEHDAGTFTVLVVRGSKDAELAALRDEAAFDAVLQMLPAAAAWTEPARSYPIDHVRAGAGLFNHYRPQPSGVRGLLAVGDAVCTTNPSGARGVSLGLESAAALADVVAGSPFERWAAELDAWCESRLRPWFEDHLVVDASLAARWAGEPLDPEGPIGSDTIAAAAQDRPWFMPVLGPYFGMQALPATLDPLRAQVRELLRDGWRPPARPGVTRDDLVAALAPVSTRQLVDAAGG